MGATVACLTGEQLQHTQISTCESKAEVHRRLNEEERPDR